jgi:TRAP-type C4-dicarboxylate transport system substrate-binding protein
MRLTRSLPALVTALFATFLATGVAAQTVLRFGHANSPGEVAHDLYKEFADNVTKKSGGQLTVRVFPSEQLGKEVDLLQQLKSGALDISSPSMPTLNSMVPAFEMPSAPFLWKDWKEAQHCAAHQDLVLGVAQFHLWYQRGAQTRRHGGSQSARP